VGELFDQGRGNHLNDVQVGDWIQVNHTHSRYFGESGTVKEARVGFNHVWLTVENKLGTFEIYASEVVVIRRPVVNHTMKGRGF